MYSVQVQASFSATHRLRLPDGTREPLHGHDWRIQVVFDARTLDDCGMVVDFELARRRLNEVANRLHHRDLNQVLASVAPNPTAEIVARYIFEQLSSVGLPTLRCVRITEAPGCIATYERDNDVREAPAN